MTPTLAGLYPGLRFTHRQRQILNRLMAGESVCFVDLRRNDRESALRLHKRNALTFTAPTNHLILTPAANAVRVNHRF